MMPIIRPLIIFITILNFTIAEQTSPSELVTLGIAKYKSGDYDGAITLFKEAQTLLPDDQLVAYNLGCAYVMQDSFDNAAEQLRLAAAGRDTKTSALARGLSAEIGIRHARSLLASPPEATTPDVREKVMQLIDDAESWYTEIIELEPNNNSVRRDLERLRTWRVQTRNAWQRVDRSSLRRGDSAKYLDEVCRELRESRNDIRNLITEPDSPKKFQSLYQLSKNVNELADDLQSFAIEPPLPQSPDTTNPQYIADVDDKEHQNVREKAGELAANLETAAKPLKLFQPENAVQTLTDSLITANNLQATVSSYEPLLRNAIERQSTLLKNNNADNTITDEVLPSDEQSFEQQLTSQLIPSLLSKSRTFLSQWKPDEPKVNETQANDSPTNQDATNPLSEKNRRLAESMLLLQKNVTELEDSMRSAVNELAASNHATAASQQQRALQLLLEILQPLNEPNEADNNDNQNDQDNKDETDDKNNGNKQSQEESKKEEQSDQEKQNKQQSENQNESAQNKNEQNGKTQPPPTEQQSKEQAAERMIRQMQRRQQEAEEGREKIKALLRTLTPVEKDW
jgi:hypothetical protein